MPLLLPALELACDSSLIPPIRAQTVAGLANCTPPSTAPRALVTTPSDLNLAHYKQS